MSLSVIWRYKIAKVVKFKWDNIVQDGFVI